MKYLLVLVMLLGSVFAEDKLVLLYGEDGTLMNSFSGVKQAAVEKNTRTKDVMSVEMITDFEEGKWGWCGWNNPGDFEWGDYKKFKFIVINTSKEDTPEFYMNIKDFNSKPGDREDWAELPIKLKPGKNEITLDISKLETKNKERKMNKDEIKFWHFGFRKPLKAPIYLWNVWLEK